MDGVRLDWIAKKTLFIALTMDKVRVLQNFKRAYNAVSQMLLLGAKRHLRKEGNRMLLKGQSRHTN